jgi:thioredoxin-related protein
MKYLLFSFALLFSVHTMAQLKADTPAGDINWISLEEAEKRMTKEPRKVLIDVYTEWCGPCKMMNNTTFKDPAVVKYINDNYYAVKFNAEGQETITFKGNVYKNDNYDPAKAKSRNATHDLTKAIAPVNGRIAYPTIVYLDESFQILSPVQGMQRPEQIMPILTFFGDDVYKDKTWQEYSQASN